MSNKHKFIAMMLLLVTSLFFAFVFAEVRMGNSGMGRHLGMMGGIPAEYRNQTNPLEANNEVINQGRKLYQENCVSCHGEKGYGDGPAGSQLSPKPANLTGLMRMPMMARDDYLFWAISEGGKRFNTPMPAYKEVLTEDERWKIIHFLRTL